MQLSIIVPVYNVEKYVRPCIESIFKQGLDEDCFEVIIVNDGTQDNSMEMIQDIIEAHHNIKVIEQPNQGLSVARNNGIEKATGEYIIFVDSDDMLVENCLPLMLGKAIETKADLLLTDYLETRDNDIDKVQVITNKDVKTIEKNGERIILEDINPFDCHVWHSLYKREFLLQNDIKFVPGIYYEDIPFTYECAIKAKTCLRIYTPMYIYRKGNASSITSNFSKKSGLDYGTALGKTWELTHKNDLSPEVVAKLKQNLFVSFSYLIYLVTHDIPHLSERMEILNHIKNIAPDMKFDNGLKQTFVDFMYKKTPCVFLTLRSCYAIIFEKSIWNIRRRINIIKNR